METNNKNPRRQFLRNTILATIAGTAMSNSSKAASLLKTKKIEPLDIQSCDPTTLDLYGQGPFYTGGAPTIVNNQLAASNEPGTRLIISGVVRTLNCSLVIPNTLIDIWHADNSGAYDNTGFTLRGKTYSNAQGFYVFETIIPGKYLNGNQFRPSHIHFKITPPGFATRITQIYWQGDTDIPADAAASVTSGTYDATHRIIHLTQNTQGVYEGTWDIIVNGNGTTGVEEMYLDKGLIYKASPNPFTDLIEINYGVFQPSKVSIQIFDMKGTMLAILDERKLDPQKYTATWNAGDSLASGIYWISLKINDLQVHYQKVIKI